MVNNVGKVVGCACTVAQCRTTNTDQEMPLAAMQQQELTCRVDQGSSLSFELGIVKLALHPCL